MTPFEAGYSKTPLWKKLGCKPEHPVYLLSPPDGFHTYLEEHGFHAFAVALDAVPEGAAHVHLFGTSAQVVLPTMRALSTRIARDGQVWLSWPKKSSGVAHDLPKSLLHQADTFGDLVDIKVCAVDATWSGLKYVVRKERR